MTEIWEPRHGEDERESCKPKVIRNIALKISYQGQGFAGWQCQPCERTVEGELRKALNKLHKRSLDFSVQQAGLSVNPNAGESHGIVVYAAGRTDSGVHAIGQVANFYSDISSDSLPDHKFREALNSQLPKDLRVLRSWEVPAGFHARYSARARVYHYRIVQSSCCSPEQRLNAWYVRPPQLDIAVLNCMVAALIGEHDFSAFTVAGDQAKTKRRQLYAASFYFEGPYIIFRVVGNAFLWHMVRSIVGTAVGIYNQHFKLLGENATRLCRSQPSADNLYEQLYQQRFALRDQMAGYLVQQGLHGGHTGFNAPAHGLTLSQVIYPEQGDLPWQWQL